MPRGSGSVIQFGQIVVSSDSADLRDVRQVLADVLREHGYPSPNGVVRQDVEKEVQDAFDEKKEMAELRDMMSTKEDNPVVEKVVEPWKR